MKRHNSRVAATILAVACSLTLAACGSNPIKDAVNNAAEDAVEAGVEKAVENQTGADVDINVGENASLPADFPSELPLPDGGSIVSSIKVDNGWGVNYAFDSADAGAASVSALTDAFVAQGWTESNVTDMGEFKAWVYENDSYVVSLAAITDTENNTSAVTYNVGTKQ